MYVAKGKTDIWKTPAYLYDKYMKAGYFDPCPIDPQFDGLAISWPDLVYCNPPYSQLNKWIDKAIAEASRKKDYTILLLIPARTDTKAFRKLYEFGALFMFITGRLKFNDAKGSPPFASVLVVLRKYYEKTKTSDIYFIDKEEL